MMRKISRVRTAAILAGALAMLTLAGCEEAAPEDDGATTSQIPGNYNGRPVDYAGIAYVDSTSVEILAWDSGQVDGDIVTIVVNGTVVFDNYTLTGTPTPRSLTLNNGFNYILLYAHNEGSISPNTAAVDLDDGASYQNLVLSADLTSNSAMDIVVR
ncbi:MAG: hypothetical protein ACOC28_00450 [Alkalispirochaetaceae bacterium]